MNIKWSEDISQTVFLQDYWQQKPLLLPQAFPEFVNPLDENELAGLACDEDAASRFMQHVQGDEWRMCTGPLEESFFEELSGNRWSLLVSDIEKLLPDFRSYLQPFRFIPDWRIDDLMISYAPVGGSVGAHIDQYDVFLLQASGIREWQIETTPRHSPHPSTSASISLLSDFHADQTMELVAGDMLYLPPGYAHHGIAKEEPCMTWSVGFRAPSADEMLPSVLNYLIEELNNTNRFTDLRREPASSPGLLSTDDQKKLRKIIRDALTCDDEQLDNWIGRYLTEPKHTAENAQVLTHDWNQIKQNFTNTTRLAARSDKILAYTTSTICATLFADGDHYSCTTELARQLCDNRWLTLDQVTSTDQPTVTALYNQQILFFDSDVTH